MITLYRESLTSDSEPRSSVLTNLPTLKDIIKDVLIFFFLLLLQSTIFFFHILHFSAKQSAILQKNNVSTKKNLQHWRRFDNFVIYLTVSINSKYAGRKIPRQRSGTQRGLQRL